jgi:hypothetical protein
MTYDEFTSYLNERILAIRTFENKRAFTRKYASYSEAAHKAVLECRAFFDRFTLDEGPHNDYNPNSKASVEVYRAAMYEQIAAAVSQRAGAAGAMHNMDFLNSVLTERLSYGEKVSDQRFARVASEFAANAVFKRTCAECGAKYDVAIKAQTYRLVSNHPATCKIVPAAPVHAAKTVVNAKAEFEAEGNGEEPLIVRLMRWEARQNNIKGPVIPQEMLKPTLKPAYNSPVYRANTKAALRLYADFLKFYEDDPSPKSQRENNQREMERIYNVVIRTVFNFDSEANKKQ